MLHFTNSMEETKQGLFRCKILHSTIINMSEDDKRSSVKIYIILLVSRYEQSAILRQANTMKKPVPE